MTEVTPSRADVGSLMRRANPATLLRTGDMPMLTAKPVETPRPQPGRQTAELFDRRVGLCLTATQMAALRKMAGDVPVSRWVTRLLEQQGIVPQVKRDDQSL